MPHLMPLQHVTHFYRLYCEDTYRSVIISILEDYPEVTGYTLIEATGYYRATKEKSLIIEIFDVDESTVIELAEEIREATNQESVAVMEVPGTVVMVTANPDNADGTDERLLANITRVVSQIKHDYAVTH